YVWADGVYLQARMEPQADCMLVLIGATPEGKKELLGFQVGIRESSQSWRELLVDLKARGLAIAPELATGDGALGFWRALEEVSPGTRHQRCTVHKTANVLDKLPTSVQPAAKRDLRQIWPAPDRTHQRCAVTGHGTAHGVQADHDGGKDLAAAEGRKSVAEGHCRRHVSKRHRGDRHVKTDRRLITASPRFPHSSRSGVHD